MISSWISEPGAWHWFLLAIALTILEVLTPTAFFMWLAVAAGLVGVVLAFFSDIGWQIQLVLFAILSVLSLVIGRHYLKHHPIATDEPMLNKRGHQYIGRVFTLDQPIVNGVGRLHVDDTSWKVAGEDCLAGTRVTVTGVDGVVLLVACIGSGSCPATP